MAASSWVRAGARVVRNLVLGLLALVVVAAGVLLMVPQWRAAVLPSGTVTHTASAPPGWQAPQTASPPALPLDDLDPAPAPAAKALLAEAGYPDGLSSTIYATNDPATPAASVDLYANERDQIDEVRAGDIAACVGLKDVTTGETLCDPDAIITLEKMVFPEPVIHQAVEPKTKADQEKMGIALGRLAQEDPSFRLRTDEESGQTIISGMGELHLEIIVDRMKREFGVEANVGKPQVAYRETIRKTVSDVEGKFVRQSGGKGQYGHVVLKIEPNEAGKGFEFVDAIKGGVVPREYIPAVNKGVVDSLPNGVLAGYPVVDVKVTLTFGSYHEVDSSENAFKMAASLGFKEACRRASPVILEPMMAVEVETPEDYAGNVMGDLSSRRGMVQGMDDMVGGGKAIKAEVPLSEMFGYSTTLRSMSQGRATYTMEFKHYTEAPRNVSEAIMAARAK